MTRQTRSANSDLTTEDTRTYQVSGYWLQEAPPHTTAGPHPLVGWLKSHCKERQGPVNDTSTQHTNLAGGGKAAASAAQQRSSLPLTCPPQTCPHWLAACTRSRTGPLVRGPAAAPLCTCYARGAGKQNCVFECQGGAPEVCRNQHAAQGTERQTDALQPTLRKCKFPEKPANNSLAYHAAIHVLVHQLFVAQDALKLAQQPLALIRTLQLLCGTDKQCRCRTNDATVCADCFCFHFTDVVLPPPHHMC